MNDKKYWLLGIFFILLALNILNMTLNNSYEQVESQYSYFNYSFIPFTAIISVILAVGCFIIIKKNKGFREKQEKIESILDNSLEHEENLQHDENEEPKTFVNTEEIESLEHEDDVLHDKNEEPVTFAKEDDRKEDDRKEDDF